ncbi:hypothetical protein OMO38_10235 [Chryseobacterium sp. 09-1422]|uniref:Baseplate structural protein Gp10 C-terminal domain-containing protein n=1 Tax=Chryseobacterium kimseyorum TaxID=2984028 RepID=A0ABT3HYM7_9FLAO|nr:hypothetical protein [Chryseobacterium kimseyorum]MCW3168899.1 hypothetical protein [Chryseobacterium kimseyorum]
MRLNFKFMQTDGVPLTADLMDQIQEAYTIFNVLGNIAGHLTILSGCEVVGTLVSPGIVAIGGDVLAFEGGTVDQTVFIQQEDITKVFKNQVSKVLIQKKTVKFGNASVTYNWDEFVRIPTLKEMKEAIDSKANQSDLDLVIADIEVLKMKTAPVFNGGVIWAFNRPVDEIPDGWKECLDTRGKTIVGHDPDDNFFDTFGVNVGSKTHQLTAAQLPQLSGTIYTIAPSSDNGSGIISIQNQSTASIGGSSVAYMHKNIRISFGGNQAHNIVQPSRIALFIEPNFQ